MILLSLAIKVENNIHRLGRRTVRGDEIETLYHESKPPQNEIQLYFWNASKCVCQQFYTGMQEFWGKI